MFLGLAGAVSGCATARHGAQADRNNGSSMQLAVSRQSSASETSIPPEGPQVVEESGESRDLRPRLLSGSRMFLPRTDLSVSGDRDEKASEADTAEASSFNAGF